MFYRSFVACQCGVSPLRRSLARSQRARQSIASRYEEGSSTTKKLRTSQDSPTNRGQISEKKDSIRGQKERFVYADLLRGPAQAVGWGSYDDDDDGGGEGGRVELSRSIPRLRSTRKYSRHVSIRRLRIVSSSWTRARAFALWLRDDDETSAIADGKRRLLGFKGSIILCFCAIYHVYPWYDLQHVK